MVPEMCRPYFSGAQIGESGVAMVAVAIYRCMNDCRAAGVRYSPFVCVFPVLRGGRGRADPTPAQGAAARAGGGRRRRSWLVLTSGEKGHAAAGTRGARFT